MLVGPTKHDYVNTLLLIKYYPVVMQFIVFLNFLDYYILGGSVTNWFYPVFGHSLIFDILLLYFSRVFKFCAWHRLLIWNLILNITTEWVIINFNLNNYLHIIMDISLLVSIFLCVLSYLLKIRNNGKFGH